jgi:uncharacterized protein
MDKLRIGVFGAGGLIGSELMNSLKDDYEMVALRSDLLYSGPGDISLALNGINIVVNLSGYPISGRWNSKTKKKIYDSRVITTSNLVTAISLMSTKPFQLINASAVGIYSDGVISDENSVNFADNFLADVVYNWETAARKVQGTGLTVLRLGVVLSRKGGAYPLIRKTFMLGFGGKFGSGQQGFSYIHIDDLMEVFKFIITNHLTGTVNAVAPEPVTNAVFTQELAGVLHRPAFLNIPSILVKMILAEGSTVILFGQKVIPARLLAQGFKFVGNNVKNCLNMLEK